jgi:hypothetical protein
MYWRELAWSASGSYTLMVWILQLHNPSNHLKVAQSEVPHMTSERGKIALYY